MVFGKAVLTKYTFSVPMSCMYLEHVEMDVESAGFFKKRTWYLRLTKST